MLRHSDLCAFLDKVPEKPLAWVKFDNLAAPSPWRRDCTAMSFRGMPIFRLALVSGRGPQDGASDRLRRSERILHC